MISKKSTVNKRNSAVDWRKIKIDGMVITTRNERDTRDK